MITAAHIPNEGATEVVQHGLASSAAIMDNTSMDSEQIINKAISSLPLIRYLRSQVTAGMPASDQTNFKEFHLHSNMKPSDFAAHLVSGSLYGQTKLPIYPRLFIQAQPVCRVIAVCYIGSHLCGHPGYVHGGALFALFDDIFARCAAMVVPSGVGMTANLNIDFRKPSIPNRIYVLRARVIKHEGRKVWVNGSVRCLPPLDSEKYRGF
ncbi:hypothetical protein NPX13_g10514 [Xylaria arbuscula]|uniref:Thioesterase domain-containing protein n=1 Tax=Xylaria arbuscula TaxID=114810 RepID=A0A9W8N4H0_9PEZI|nr:hypothetical protein NPX13_g10514 [Xylaria arbuscula]